MIPEIVLGPPGTGKTTTMLGVVDEALGRGVPPDRIGYVSFTQRAAYHARDGAAERFSLQPAQLPYFRTLHSICFRVLGLRSEDVLQGPRLREFADYAGVRITGRWSDDGTFSGFEQGDRMLFLITLARVRCVPLRQLYDEDSDGLPWNQLVRVEQALRAFKAARGLVDFNDMLENFVTEDRAPRLEHLVVDEAQDLSELQWRVVERLARDCRRVVVAGDDDQAIFRWAGASVDRLIEMRGEVRVLGQSWRVPRLVQDVALGLIDRVARRRPKQWNPRGDEGELDHAARFDEVDLSGPDVMVLARNNYVIRDLVEPLLRQRGIYYEVDGRPSIRPSLMSAIQTWEALRRGEQRTAAEVREVYAQIDRKSVV